MEFAGKFFRKKILLFTVVFMGLALIVGSGGGGSGGSGTIENPPAPGNTPSLSVYQADPGQFITITHNSITADERSTTEFRGSDGYLITAEITDTTNGSAKVAVPVFIDPRTGKFAEGDVSVVINGEQIEGKLTIREPEDPGIDGGLVFGYFLKKSVENYEKTVIRLQQLESDLGVDVSADVYNINQRITVLNTMINQIETTSTVQIDIGSGQSFLSEDDLKFLDRMLVASISGINDELNVRGLRSVQRYLNTKAGLGDTAEERLEAVQGMIDNVISEFHRGLEGGKIYIGGMTVGFAVAGALVGGPVGGIVGAAAGLAMGYFSAGYELGTAALYNKVSTSLSDNFREAYDVAGTTLDQLIRVGAALASAATQGASDIVKGIAGFISTSLSTYDTVKACESTKCNESGQRQLSRNLLKADTVFTVDEFCNDYLTLPDDIFNDFLVATIELDGYAKVLMPDPDSVEIWYGEISDGEGHVFLADIPSIIGTDGTLDQNAMLNQATLSIMIDPDLSSGPGTYDVSGDIDLQDGGNAMILFSTPAISNEYPYIPFSTPVIFSGSGIITLHAYSPDEGSLIKGTFSVTVSDEQEFCPTDDEDDCTEKTISGTISGSFEGVLVEPSD